MPTWLIADPSAEAGALESLPPTDDLRLVTKPELIEKDMRFGLEDKLCITSEGVMDEALARWDDPVRRQAVQRLKDKLAFRAMLTDLYPDFSYSEVGVAEIEALTLDPRRRYVLKPAKGCFGSGVRVIRGDQDLTTLRIEVERELERNAALFSRQVLTPDIFILEDYVEGEEYAVDMFYDSEGEVVITNIYHHPLPAHPEYLHMLYTSSRPIFDSLHDPALEFFRRLNDYLDVRNLPLHAEFRMTERGLAPIEINSLRFGGMGLTNLTYYALGQNAYRCFVEDQPPDWEELWSDVPDDTVFGFFIAYNGSRVDTATQVPDREKLRRRFTEVLKEIPFDHREQLAFGIAYIKEPASRLPELLEIDFNDYFVPKEAP